MKKIAFLALLLSSTLTLAKTATPKKAVKLTPMQEYVTKHGGTEAPFQNEYWNEHRDGIYVDVVTREALFSSLDKYDSGTGWPSFTKPIKEDMLIEKKDDSLSFQSRTEIKSKASSSHLGHVFNDRPTDTGKPGMRYCINSAALLFVPLEKMQIEGYGEYLYLFKDRKFVPK